MTNPATNDTGGIFFKVDIINDAYSQMRINGLTLKPLPEELELALNRLEDMAAEWATKNVCANYNFEDEPDPNSRTNIKRGYKQAYATNLAVRLIPDFNKQVPQTLIGMARQSYSSLSGRCAMERINGVPYPDRQPRGSGNTLRYNRWNRFYRNQGIAPNSNSTQYITEGDINDYTEHFDAYLNDGETIASFEIVTDPAIELQTSSNTDTDALYRIKAGSTTSIGSLDNQQLTIIMTTSDGRVETRFVYFNITPLPSDT